VTDLASELLGPSASRPPLLRAHPVATVSFTIRGEPASKANSRQLVTLRKKGEEPRPASIKSKKARAYEHNAQYQIPRLPILMIGPLRATIRIWYTSELPDLDESIILDVMQGRIFRNDRQVREKHVFHGIDRSNPRAHVTIEAMTAQQESLL